MSDVPTIIEGIIDNAIQTGQKSTQEALNYAASAAYTGTGMANVAPVGAISFNPVAGRPTLPAGIDNTAAIEAAFQSSYAMFDARFQRDIAYVLDNFFPDISGQLASVSDTWIINQISGDSTGLSPAAEQALYTRGKERLTEDAYRAETEAMTLFASRGFSLPPGVLFAKVQEVQQLALDKAGDLSRDVLVENTKIKVETLKFAVEQSTKLRLSMFDSLARFLEASSRVPMNSVQYAGEFVNARKGVAEAIIGYYNALLKEGELDLTAHIKREELLQTNYNIYASTNVSAQGHHVSAVVGAANAVGQLAQAAMSSQNTVTNLGHTVSESI